MLYILLGIFVLELIVNYNGICDDSVISVVVGGVGKCNFSYCFGDYIMLLN